MILATLLLAVLPPQTSDWLSTVSVPDDAPPPKAEADWIDVVSPEAPKPDCDCKECNCGNVKGDVESLASITFAHEQEIAELKAAVEELRQKQLTTKAATPVDLSGILREIAELKARPAFTEEEIRSFAKDEIQKFHAEVKMKDGTVKTVEATGVQVSVNGYSGKFEVPPGGVVTAINGVPVSPSNGWTRVVNPATNRTSSVFGQTPNFNVRAVPSRSTVRFFASPRSNGTCRIVNGVKVCN